MFKVSKSKSFFFLHLLFINVQRWKMMRNIELSRLQCPRGFVICFSPTSNVGKWLEILKYSRFQGPRAFFFCFSLANVQHCKMTGNIQMLKISRCKRFFFVLLLLLLVNVQHWKMTCWKIGKFQGPRTLFLLFVMLFANVQRWKLTWNIEIIKIKISTSKSFWFVFLILVNFNVSSNTSTHSTCSRFL